MRCAYLSHPDCALHSMGERHPESPARIGAVEAGLRHAGLLARLQRHDAPLVTREQLLRVHEGRYLDGLELAQPREGTHRLDPDTALGPRSLDAARRAAGAVVRAVDLVMGGEATTAFCAVRPPGHHARRSAAMGFCIYGNVADGVADALAVHGLKRVAVVDFDVHHGNGTEEMFRNDARVLLADSFQHPYYPHAGSQPRPGFVPMPLAAGSGGKAFREAWLHDGLPALRAFRPELVFFSAGFDAHRDDPLAQLQLDADDYRWLTQEVAAIAAASARGRVVSALEGGYHLEAIGRAAGAHVGILADG
ncbi:MAG: histone deacetylase family protein [Thermomicrobiales bacterium]|nr:MAG: histone deacetylase family protein [Thermomicrobiales bacterium]